MIVEKKKTCNTIFVFTKFCQLKRVYKIHKGRIRIDSASLFTAGCSYLNEITGCADLILCIDSINIKRLCSVAGCGSEILM